MDIRSRGEDLSASRTAVRSEEAGGSGASDQTADRSPVHTTKYLPDSTDQRIIRKNLFSQLELFWSGMFSDGKTFLISSGVWRIQGLSSAMKEMWRPGNQSSGENIFFISVYLEMQQPGPHVDFRTEQQRNAASIKSDFYFCLLRSRRTSELSRRCSF